MPLDKNTLKSALDKKYTDFSNAIKTELQAKLDNNPKMKSHKDTSDKIKDMKDIFAKISIPKEPEKTEPPTELEKDIEIAKEPKTEE